MQSALVQTDEWQDQAKQPVWLSRLSHVDRLNSSACALLTSMAGRHRRPCITGDRTLTKLVHCAMACSGMQGLQNTLDCNDLLTKAVCSAARAGGITAASLVAGAAIGSAAQSWLRVDIVPIGVSLFAFWCQFAAALNYSKAPHVLLSAPSDRRHIFA